MEGGCCTARGGELEIGRTKSVRVLMYLVHILNIKFMKSCIRVGDV